MSSSLKVRTMVETKTKDFRKLPFCLFLVLGSQRFSTNVSDLPNSFHCYAIIFSPFL